MLMNNPETRIMFSKFNQYCNMYYVCQTPLVFTFYKSKSILLNIFLYNEVLTNYQQSASTYIYKLFCKQQTVILNYEWRD